MTIFSNKLLRKTLAILFILCGFAQTVFSQPQPDKVGAADLSSIEQEVSNYLNDSPKKIVDALSLVSQWNFYIKENFPTIDAEVGSWLLNLDNQKKRILCHENHGLFTTAIKEVNSHQGKKTLAALKTSGCDSISELGLTDFTKEQTELNNISQDKLIGDALSGVKEEIKKFFTKMKTSKPGTNKNILPVNELIKACVAKGISSADCSKSITNLIDTWSQSIGEIPDTM